MGDFADDMINREIERHLNVFESRRPYKAPGYLTMSDEELGDLTWQTAEGEQLRVRDMKRGHRRNALALLKRRHGEKKVKASRIGVALTVWADREEPK